MDFWNKQIFCYRIYLLQNLFYFNYYFIEQNRSVVFNVPKL